MKLLLENWKNYLLLEQQSESDRYFIGLLDRLPEKSISIVGKTIRYTKFAEEKGVKGYMSLSAIPDCNGAFKVHWVEATKGWGSLLYELSIEKTEKTGFIADRKSTTQAALSVWNRLMQRQDLTKTPIDINGRCSLNMLHHYLNDNLEFVAQPTVERTKANITVNDNRWLQLKQKNPQAAVKLAAQTPFGNIITKPNPSVLKHGLDTGKIVEGVVY
jgi:hypothetical protein